MIATNTRAVIGSANASENSTLADDAVVITDDPDIIASVRNFIDSLDEITEVDQVFLDDAILEWEIGRAVPLPGVTGRVRTETDFLPTPVTRMFVKHAVDYEPTPTEQQVLDEQRGRHHSRGGPAAKYQLESLRLDRPSGVRRGDVIIFGSADDEWIYAPAVVVSDPMKIPRSGGAVLYFLRLRTGLSPLPLQTPRRRSPISGTPGHGCGPTTTSAPLALGPRCWGCGTSDPQRACVSVRVSAAEPDKPDCWHAGRHQIPRHGAALLESSDAGVAVTIGRRC